MSAVGLLARYGLSRAAAPATGVTRQSTGLIFADTFEDGDVSDWTTVGSLSREASTSSPKFGTYALRTSVNDASNGHWAYREFAGHSGNFAAQYWVRQNIAKTFFITLTDDKSHALDETALALTILVRASPQEIRVLDATTVLALGAYSTDTWYKVTHVVDVGNDTADSYLDNVIQQSGHTLRSGIGGVNTILLGNSGAVPERVSDIDNIVICIGHTVSCSGLPSGHKLRVTAADGTTTAVATESSGTASVDVLTLDWPMTKVEVLDGSNNVVATVTEAVYGGDVYALS